MKAWGKKFFIGRETRPGWRGFLPCYLFWCKRCEHWVKDYLHGHEGYLVCPNCKQHHEFITLRVLLEKLFGEIRALAVSVSEEKRNRK